ncbi:hypothetical protein [Pseudoroseomonas cervicalis]|uniref:hypothetical protein n=1 Tax=Teichococcus cervicalis TaxID=204525 RepID=UPI002786323A|nr:hypothetical protein [Pseudoroseomonas cervicalis]MDQ1081212.1 hypothetical protein [Pseudoroseomonas cervicalis]
MDTAKVLIGLVTLLALTGGFAILWSRQRMSTASTSLRDSPAAPATASPSQCWHCLKDSLSIPAEILYRTAGPGTHEWHDIEVRELWGEPGKGTTWLMVREIAYAEAGRDAL